MGTRTTSDVVPFVVHNVLFHEHCADLESELEENQMLFCPHGYSEGEFCDNPKDIVLHEWQYQNYDPQNPQDSHFGKKNSLYGDLWIKDQYRGGQMLRVDRVWLINESGYSTVGEYDMAVVANDKKSLEEFVKDFNITNPIEEMDAVQHTG